MSHMSFTMTNRSAATGFATKHQAGVITTKYEAHPRLGSSPCRATTRVSRDGLSGGESQRTIARAGGVARNCDEVRARRLGARAGCQWIAADGGLGGGSFWWERIVDVGIAAGRSVGGVPRADRHLVAGGALAGDARAGVCWPVWRASRTPSWSAAS